MGSQKSPLLGQEFCEHYKPAMDVIWFETMKIFVAWLANRLVSKSRPVPLIRGPYGRLLSDAQGNRHIETFIITRNNNYKIYFSKLK